VFRYCGITEEMLNYLTLRHTNYPRKVETTIKVAVTTGILILLRATSHGDDSSVIQAVAEIDTISWCPKLLYSKIYTTTSQKLKESKERARMLASDDPAAVHACLGRKVTKLSWLHACLSA